MGVEAPLAVIAIGGHVIHGQRTLSPLDEVSANAARLSRALHGLLEDGYRLVVTHGNGPQVGAALLRSEQARNDAYSLSLNLCVATTQGEIGYLLQQAMQQAIRVRRGKTPVATVITQVVVDEDDPAMRRPTKPIGPLYLRHEAVERRNNQGWMIVSDPPRGYRRVVPSPRPVEIVEEPVIKQLSDRGTVVIAGGGGGIPVVRGAEGLRGMDAVVDKDYTSALLAANLRAQLYINVTGVDRVYLDFLTEKKRGLGHVTRAEMQRHLVDGHFPAGSMGPKVESALEFLDRGGSESIITSCDMLNRVLDVEVGTRIARE